MFHYSTPPPPPPPPPVTYRVKCKPIVKLGLGRLSQSLIQRSISLKRD